MKEWLIKKLGGYTEAEYSNSCFSSYLDEYDYQRQKGYITVLKNFFLDEIYGKNRNEYGKFTSRDSLKEYFAWCHTYGQMPNKKLTNAFMRYERNRNEILRECDEQKMLQDRINKIELENKCLNSSKNIKIKIGDGI